MVDLPDVNVWFALHITNHPHHQRAERYWYEEAAAQIAFCRITALGFQRLCTNPRATDDQPLTVPDAWSAYAELRSLPEVSLAPEPEGCEEQLRSWASTGIFLPRQWTDAYLAAFARAGEYRLVTFDRDFTRFPDLQLLRLEP